MINLFPYQEKAVKDLKTGAILWGGVGSGKSITSLAYYYIRECGGEIKPHITKPRIQKDLYIITTARKRDSLDWERDAANFALSPKREASVGNVLLTVDSWNNLPKYKEVKDAFFIFDEQKLVGSGSWVKSFLKIVKENNWILLSATPGDTWMDYVPIFIANGFYKNRTQFIRQHVVYNSFSKYPKIDRYVEESTLISHKNSILVKMDYVKKTIDHIIEYPVTYDENLFDQVYKDRWNPYTNEPIKDASEACYIMRKVTNSDPSRIEAIVDLVEKHRKLIVFYNFDYELEILRGLHERLTIPIAEYNGHLHEEIPQGESWIYLAQYISAGEAWNCIETNVIVLYSRSYSYKITRQAMGRIDRQNTPFLNLYYYFLASESKIDRALVRDYRRKQNFNESRFYHF